MTRTLHAFSALAIVLIASCGKRPSPTVAELQEENARHREAENERELRESVQRFADAIKPLQERNPDAQFYIGSHPLSDLLTRFFTFDEQLRVARLKGRPVIIVAELRDIFIDQNGFQMVLNNVFGDTIIMSCSESQAMQIRNNCESDPDAYTHTVAVAGRVLGSQIVWDRDRYAEITYEAEEDSESSEAEVVDGGPNPLIIYTGKCSDIAYLKDIDLYLEWRDYFDVTKEQG